MPNFVSITYFIIRYNFRNTLYKYEYLKKQLIVSFDMYDKPPF